jgi:hypothetical protein
MMNEINEPSNELLLRYLRGLLPATEAALLESKCTQDESWQDQLDYLQAVLDDLGLAEDIPFDLCLSLLNYELCARREQTLIALEAFVEAEEETYELELEIDKLLNHLEQLAHRKPPTISERLVSQAPQALRPAPEFLDLPPSRFTYPVYLVAVSVKFVGRVIHRGGSLLEELCQGKRKRSSRFPLTAAEPAPAKLVAAGNEQNLFLNKG